MHSIKHWIDEASYIQLLERWRFAPVGDPIFQAEAGKYYQKVMITKRDENLAKAIDDSKLIGWGYH